MREPTTRIIDLLESEAAKRGKSLGDLAVEIGMSTSHIYAIRHGKQPGLQTCLDIARGLNLRPDLVLYWAGHITEEELDAPEHIPPELLPTIKKLAQMRGTPFYDFALTLVEEVIEKAIELFRVAA